MTLTTAIWSKTGPKGVRFELTLSGALFYVLFAAVIASFQGLSIAVLLVPFMFLLAVLAHEWGHAWMAMRQGLAVKRIAVTFGGGLCDSDGGDVGRVFWMVLMGPMASLAMAVLGFVTSIGAAVIIIMFKGVDPAMTGEHTQVWEWLLIFALINLAVCVLNLFPFQPLDGGKLLHLGLACVLHPDRARHIAGGVGLALGVIWIPFMVWTLFNWALFLPVFPHLQTHWKMVFGCETGPEVLQIKPTPEPA